MIGNCTSPVWRRDDFTACFRHDYLQTILPVILVAASISYLAFQVIFALRQNKSYEGYKLLAQAQPNGDYVPPDSSRFIDDEDELAQDGNDDIRDEENNNGYVDLTHTKTHESVIEASHPRGELLLVFVEELAVLAQLGIHLAILLLNIWGRKGRVAAIAELTTWAYVTVLASLRLLLSSQTRFQFSRLWYHTAFIYCFIWFFNALTFRSEIIHPTSKGSLNLSIVDFILTTLLALISLTSRKGNRVVKLEYEADIEPSKEQIASVLSLASFTWMDTLIWRGYKKPLEIIDVWNIPPRDKAANLLADYRQLKRTSVLAFHLLRYFKRSLLIQAAWAAITGLLTFVPTILLKVILEYVENPVDNPKSAAWFYVILLPVSGAIKAVADGQSLWIGRKICIRLKAIIIGELYAKALKRKASSSSDKVLGGVDKKSDNDTKAGLFKRIFGKNKKSKPVAQENGTLKKESNEKSQGQVTTGTIINLMAIDSYKVSEICAYLHFLWASTPVQFFGTIALLYGVLGFSSFVGIGMMGLLLPVNMWLSTAFSKLQKTILAATDQRIHITNEVLSNIRIIKYFAWEQRFMSMVDEKRHVELKRLMNRYMIWALAATIWSGSPIVITLLTFLVYTRVENKDLYPSVAFTALSLFQLLRIPLDQLADMVARVQESKVSIDRVEEYLNEPETDKFKQLVHQVYDDNGDPLIGFDGGTFSWGVEGDMETEAFKLLNMDLLFQVDKLSVIVGPTGSGKTSMLMALLGEMTLLEGLVHLPGIQSREDLEADPETGLKESVAYCAQQAWLVNDTIKENIVFASPWNPDRYKDVIIACSLQRDLEILDAGDETLVGEKGVTLSGGQKQRISLARALYSPARHILLDDIFSAVDAHTAKWIFENAILGPLMEHRTCILVTHNVALCIPHADFAVVLENGRIVAKGTADEVAQSGHLAETTSKSLNTAKGASKAHSRTASTENLEATADQAGPAETINTGKQPQQKQEETKAVGSVKFSVMTLYLAAMGSWFYWTIAGVVFVGQQLISVATNVWIRQWANAYAEKESSIQGITHQPSITHITGVSGCFIRGVCGWTMPFSGKGNASINTFEEQERVNDWYYAGVYTGIGAILVIVVFIREWVLFYGSVTASRRIHTRLIESVMRAKFRFFDSTPLGQIMNRFSKDIESIDQNVTPVAMGLMYCLLSIFTIVILISIITPGFLIAGTFISILYFAIGLLYINSSRDLKRLESIKRSPLYQQFGETLTGMTTIRAYCDERRFIRENIAKLNVQNRPFIFLWAANRWLAFRIDIIGSLVSFFSSAFVVVSVGSLDAGAAGLAMTYALTYSENMLWFVRLYSSNEQNMNSVERIKEYLDVEQEAALIAEDKRPPSAWPSKGSVEFIDYSTRYRADFDTVLKKISFKILPGEKVGVVGRTGAGKSSMALALFRALEAAEGKILIDDVDISEIGLQDLREKIVMVPQDPTLFSGTIRSNLDPFGLFTDEEIFTALRGVQLIGSPGPPSSSSTTPARPSSSSNNRDDSPADTLPSILISDTSQQLSESTAVPSSAATTAGGDEDAAAAPHSPTTAPTLENRNIFVNLASPISESGANLSQGQRQLLCLARALLKEPAVLLMDEATASIDHATDAKIQETIRLLENTTITIAHRLKTIVDYDKVLVLEQGRVVEFGTPWELLDLDDGVFRGMCVGSGEMQVLLDMARGAREERMATE